MLPILCPWFRWKAATTRNGKICFCVLPIHSTSVLFRFPLSNLPYSSPFPLRKQSEKQIFIFQYFMNFCCTSSLTSVSVPGLWYHRSYTLPPSNPTTEDIEFNFSSDTPHSARTRVQPEKTRCPRTNCRKKNPDAVARRGLVRGRKMSHPLAVPGRWFTK